MSEFSKFQAGVISKAEYDSEGLGFSTVGLDFPFEDGPDAVYDQVDILMKPWGRTPAPDKLPLFINENGVDRWTRTIVTHGVDSQSAFAVPTEGFIPAVCIIIVTVTSGAVLQAIDAHASHFVLGVNGPNDMFGDPLPTALFPYQYDEPFPPTRWTVLRNGLVAMGLDDSVIDNWRTNHPEATPREFGEAFKAFIR